MHTILIIGLILLLNGISVFAQDGTPDHYFGINGTTILTSPPTEVRCSDFFQVESGYIVAAQTSVGPQLMKLTQNGKLDSTFGMNGVVDIPVSGGWYLHAALQYGNKIVAACVTSSSIIVTRWGENGARDMSFGYNGIATITFDGTLPLTRDIAVDSQNRIVVCAQINQDTYRFTGIARLLPTGAPDTDFGNQGKVILTIDDDRIIPYDITIDYEDRIAVACNVESFYTNYKRFGIFMLNPGGSLNKKFNNTGYKILGVSSASEATAIAVQNDGKVVVAGTAENDPRGSFVVVRFFPDGNLDTEFGDSGYVFKYFNGLTDVPYAMQLTSNNSIVVAGYLTKVLQPGDTGADIVIANLTPDGEPDPHFGTDGSVIYDNALRQENILSMQVQHNQQLLIGGYMYASQKYRPVMMRLRNGSPYVSLLPFIGNGILAAGTSVPLKWKHRDINYFSILLSTDGGASWNPVPGADSLHTSDSVFFWEVPYFSSTNCYLKVVEMDDTTLTYISPLFTITVPNINFSVACEPVWIDSDFDGYVTGFADGSGTTVAVGSIVNHTWLINGIQAASGTSAHLTLKTGSQSVTLLVTVEPGGLTAAHTFNVDVIASKKSLQSSIHGGASYQSGTFYIGATNKLIYGFDSTSTTTLTCQASGAISVGVCIAPGNRIFTGTETGKLICLDESLNLLWEKNPGGAISSIPTVSSDGSRVYVTTKNGSVRAFNTTDGSPIWSWATEGEIVASTMLLEFLNGERQLLVGRVGTTDLPGSLVALKDNGTSVQKVWEVPVEGPVSATPAFLNNGTNSMIFFSTDNGYLYRLRWDGFREADWKVAVAGSTKFCSPVIDWARRVYIGSTDKNIYAFDSDFTTASQPVRSFNVGLSAVGSPTLGANGYFYLGTQAGYISAFDLKQEPVKEMWKFNASGSVSSPLLLTETGKIHAALQNGDMFILAEPDTFHTANNSYSPMWSTFRGNSKRNCVIQLALTGVNDPYQVPEKFTVFQNYPNPFNPYTIISFTLPVRTRTEIAVFDIIGSEIMRSVAEYDSGHHEVTFDGSSLPSGVYFYRVTADGKQIMGKMLLLR